MNLKTPDTWADAAQVVLAMFQLILFPFVIYQVNALRKNLYSTAHSSIYARYADTIRWMLEKPHLYAYFRENVGLDSSEPSPEMALKRAEVQSLCELTTTLFEHATLERHNMPSTSWHDCWMPYIRASYEHSVEMRVFFETNRIFYVPEYCKLIACEVAPNIKPAWDPGLKAVQSR